jgi:hypothetical protein
VTKVSLCAIVVLGIVVVLLLYLTAIHTTIVAGRPVRYGWSNALSIFMLSTKPFGSGLGAPCILLAILGFVAVPAVIGAVAGIVFGEVLTAKQEALRTYVANVIKEAGAEAFKHGQSGQGDQLSTSTTPQPQSGAEGQSPGSAAPR